MPKFSIIVPVWNVEQYLPKCLDSLINQTFHDFEIICINDGSSDNSLQILCLYESLDNRIRVINKENQGASSARNLGIKNATGEYILFVDSDDWVFPDFCEKIFSSLMEADSDIINFQSYFIKNEKEKYEQAFVLSEYVEELNNQVTDFNSNPLSNFLVNDLILCWDKVYKTEFLKRNNILFSEDLKVFEDCIFMLDCYAKNPTIKYLDKYLYNHLIGNVESLSRYEDYYQKFLDHIKAEPAVVKALKPFNNKDLDFVVFRYFLQFLLQDFNKIIFSDKKQEYIEAIEKFVKNGFGNKISSGQLKDLKAYQYFKDTISLNWL